MRRALPPEILGKNGYRACSDTWNLQCGESWAIGGSEGGGGGGGSGGRGFLSWDDPVMRVLGWWIGGLTLTPLHGGRRRP